ncbi:NAD(P)/FAD-dependent oxidoreductase [Paenibacillus paeoniae]|uniref:NAD(P)/FAD-dependent oxidoreductase n=1 Tax=Paenibacillus paeoniae TaxID=2292705 RepID=A0A371P772_9BACL|nr:NAD(P)/FAD-dependent oxidoreductase [Paenibacillus paeoniae]REK71378.1 NAD(P)/FAD-dependent oxidoreductase [Paenibacillus paeoniae]
MTMIYDVVVLGGGIAGSVAAKSLAEQGWRTVVLDRQRFPRHKVCGEFLSPESLATLSRLGLLEAVQSLSPSVISSTSLYLESGGVIRLPLPGTALGISRYRLDASFHQAAAAAGASIREGATVISVNMEDRDYTITLRSEGHTEVLRARAVIAAWGGAGLAAGGVKGRKEPDDRQQPDDRHWSHSQRHEGDVKAARQGRLRSSSRTPDYVGVKMHYEMKDFAPDCVQENSAVELYFFRGGYAGVNQVEDGKVNVAALLDRDDIPSKHRSVAGMMEEAACRHPKLHERMAALHAMPATASAVSPVRISMQPVAWNGIPLIGDAICRIPPLCGDGMSMALRSAELCSLYASRYLRGELSLGDWECEYREAIMREFSKPLRWGRLTESLLSSVILSRALPALARLAPKAARGMIQATRLRI